MATKVRITLNKAGVREVLRSSEVQAELLRRAELIANAAGEGMVAESLIGASRARASVRTETLKAILAEAEDRALTSALEAGRG